MKKKQPAGIYRTFFKNAWSCTLQHKSLWVFGIFAAILQSGGLGDTLLRGFRRVEYRGEWFSNLLQDSVMGLRTAGTYLSHIATLPSWQTVLLFTAMLFALLVVFSLSVISQQILIDRVDAQTKKSSGHSFYKHVEVFERLVGIHVLAKMGGFIATLIVTLILVLYLRDQGSLYAFFVFVSFGLFVPVLIILQNLSMLAAIHAVKAKTSLLHSVAHAFFLFRSHWLATIELGVGVFLLIAIMAGFLCAILFLFLLPVAFLASFFLSTGSWVGFMTCQGVSLFAIATALFLFVGATTTFQYAVWVSFYKHASHEILGTKPIARFLRWLKK
ncbi:TPA: hypothetical protein DEP34_01275 [Candidatus Uhrbacteria bacterium]|uniref:Uncharacterized protein n=2 Tax=Candidatus Uhriibacteriota TaxID=1752732 RepID=A0A0G1SEK5_9BACT|nr:MAG: hypothetical protein UX45_C0015G0021 [Candidatus Uhrbacteria bacterium GW2011_GWF2_46_218]KKU40518.1 MAG: hypothetical protein UX57_C0015G0005 [Candidatus Uhrbacteria bacterium GW2011_GWE2_46_68]HBK33609.1 hypothetical protein [Candidatus Uhrbacteria bacterium]HCB19003.1 hypothetical protein [Candidatus Uhrbacteria bacterium]